MPSSISGGPTVLYWSLSQPDNSTNDELSGTIENELISATPLQAMTMGYPLPHPPKWGSPTKLSVRFPVNKKQRHQFNKKKKKKKKKKYEANHP